jgi:gluconate kinase
MTTMPAAPTATVVVMASRSTSSYAIFHSAANVAKMHASHALTDDDRWPWLRSIAAWIGAREQAGTTR